MSDVATLSAAVSKPAHVADTFVHDFDHVRDPADLDPRQCRYHGGHGVGPELSNLPWDV